MAKGSLLNLWWGCVALCCLVADISSTAATPTIVTTTSTVLPTSSATSSSVTTPQSSTSTTSANSTMCMSCSYQYTGHDVGKECISAPSQVQPGKVSCSNSSGCIIIAVYNDEYQKLTSLFRGCLPWEAGESDKDTLKCDDATNTPECKEICFNDSCNNGDGDLNKRRDHTTGDNSNRVVSPGLLWLLIGAAVLLILL